MREIGRQRRLRRRLTIGLAAMVALAVGGAVTATQAQAASTRPAGSGGGLSISRQFFGFAFDKYAGKNLPVYRYTLRNDRGMSVQIITYGAIVQDIWVPGRNGQVPADVVLGFKTLADYVQFDSPPVTADGRRVLRRDRRPVRQPDRQGQVHPEPARSRAGQLHPPHQQRAEQPCTAGSSASATTSGPDQPVFGSGAQSACGSR